MRLPALARHKLSEAPCQAGDKPARQSTTARVSDLCGHRDELQGSGRHRNLRRAARHGALSKRQEGKLHAHWPCVDLRLAGGGAAAAWPLAARAPVRARQIGRWAAGRGEDDPLYISAAASRVSLNCACGRRQWKSLSRLTALRSNSHETGSQVDVP